MSAILPNNQEEASLVEAFAGVAILTTNLQQNMDKAFVRRRRDVAEWIRQRVRYRRRAERGVKMRLITVSRRRGARPPTRHSERCR
jgi:hypothetical protein